MAKYFNKNLKYIRKQKNISQQELADKLDVDRSSISRWENGDMEATVDKAVEIARILDVPFAEFLSTDLTKISTDGLFDLANGLSYNEVLENEKMINAMSEANRHYIKTEDGKYIDENDLELPIEDVIKSKKELSPKEEKELLKDVLKRKGFLDENEELSEENYNRLIDFAKANKNFIMKDDNK